MTEKQIKPAKSGWIIGSIKSLCLILGAINLLALITALIYLFFVMDTSEKIEDNTYLTIDLNQKITESENGDIVSEFLGEKTLSLKKLIDAIMFAAFDERVDGIVANIDTTNLDLAQLQEIAQAIMFFKEHGKKTYIFSQGFGPYGGGSKEYYLATFFDKIYMQPNTTIGLTGVGVEVPFFRKALNKIGVEPEFYARHEYKNAMASFTDDKMTDEYKDELQSLVQSLYEILRTDVSFNRNITPESFDTIVNQAPVSAEDGLKNTLIDGIMYRVELENILQQENSANFYDVIKYAKNIGPLTEDFPVIATLNLNGIINSGESTNDIDGELVIGSKSVLKDIDEISKIPELKAMVVRINSPGGSYHAADEIYFALKQLKKERNIPIVVSQSSYAASGGYFISLAGDYILAEPATITGSIGVLGGKMVLSKMWDKLNINWSEVKIGENAGIMSMNHRFSRTESKYFNSELDKIYEDFTAKVMENRKLKKDIDEVARGRVWTGVQALELGLVDIIGSRINAIGKAMEIAGYPMNTQIRIVEFPKTKTWSEKISDILFSGENVQLNRLSEQYGVNINNLKLFKRLQYDSVLLPFVINM